MQYTGEDQIKKMFYPFETESFLKTLHITLAFKPLLRNEKCSGIKMKLVLLVTTSLEHLGLKIFQSISSQGIKSNT